MLEHEIKIKTEMLIEELTYIRGKCIALIELCITLEYYKRQEAIISNPQENTELEKLANKLKNIYETLNNINEKLKSILNLLQQIPNT